MPKYGRSSRMHVFVRDQCRSVTRQFHEMENKVLRRQPSLLPGPPKQLCQRERDRERENKKKKNKKKQKKKTENKKEEQLTSWCLPLVAKMAAPAKLHLSHKCSAGPVHGLSLKLSVLLMVEAWALVCVSCSASYMIGLPEHVKG